MFEGQAVWITGASSGIGAGLARSFAAKGAKLILSGRNQSALEDSARDCGGDAFILPFEATDFDAIPAIVDKAHSWTGRIDVLVNNAGISQRSLAVETPFPVYQKLIGIDLLAPIALTQSVLPVMAKQKSGRIAFITSVAGKVGSPLRTAYSAAKFGLNGYADSLRVEVAALGIQVHVIAPGSIRTNVSRNAITADGTRRGESDSAIENGMDADYAAGRMLRAMERGQRDFVIAKGIEHQITVLKRRSPEKLFGQMEEMMARGYTEKMKAEAEKG